MKEICTRDDLSRLLTTDCAVVYFLASWSDYAVRGLQVMNDAESSLSQDSNGMATTFWLADVSSIESPAHFLCAWLLGYGPKGKEMLIPIMTGNGSVVWLKRDIVVDFANSALSLGEEAIVEKTQAIFGGGQHNKNWSRREVR